jgi:DNA uptake protein ComE-like DNA-binding protein
MFRRRIATWLLVGVLIAVAFSAYSQLEDAGAILLQVREIIAQNYYDPTFHGYALDARFKEADQKLGDVTSFEMAMSVIGSAVQGLARPPSVPSRKSRKQDADEAAESIVKVNSASESDLMQLPDVSQATARRRIRNRPCHDREDLPAKHVGSERQYAKVKDIVTVE